VLSAGRLLLRARLLRAAAFCAMGAMGAEEERASVWPRGRVAAVGGWRLAERPRLCGRCSLGPPPPRGVWVMLKQEGSDVLNAGLYLSRSRSLAGERSTQRGA